MNRDRRKSVVKKDRKDRKQSRKPGDEPVRATDHAAAVPEASTDAAAPVKPAQESPDGGAPPTHEPEGAGPANSDRRMDRRMSRKMSRKLSRIDEYKLFTMTGSAHKRSLEEANRSAGFKAAVLLFVMVLLGGAFMGTILYVTYFVRQPKVERQPRFVSSTPMASFGGWMAVTGSKLCEAVPRRMFDMNGTIGDAAVATILCVCVVMPHRCGLGGGFFATYYNRRNKEAKAVVAREVAPSTAFPDMYRDRVNASLQGFLAVAVFGELRGYEALLNLTGTQVPWKELFTKAIEYADSGFKVTASLAKAIKDHASAITEDYTKTIKSVFFNTATSKPYEEGDLLQNKLLAETLRNISENPLKGSSLSVGPLAEAIVGDINKGGSKYITLADLHKFQPSVTNALTIPLSESEQLFTPPPPSGGVVTGFVVSIVDKFRAGSILRDDTKTWHSIVEAFKYAFAQRPLLGDPLKTKIGSLLRGLTSREAAEQIAHQKIGTNPHPDPADYGFVAGSVDDHGSGQICIVGPDGDAVVLVSSINTEFGAMVASKSTGIVLNNQMNDFSTPGTRDFHGFPPAKQNDIEGGKRPMSSLSPIVVVDRNGDVKFLGSATGGARIATSLSQVLIRSLWMGHTVKQAIDAGRLHNQLVPNNVVKYEYFADKDVIWWLGKQGHRLSPDDSQGDVIALCRIGPEVAYSGSYDFRTMGDGGLDGGPLP
ncbi:hypothetical protein V5799_013061 [Amblyomma americanum]|uniref:Gamma-glutamyltransferase n=1 Tax=Amblyomma americanum TaxID=6943 RepID=A0AAQ4E6X6_AMBAM